MAEVSQFAKLQVYSKPKILKSLGEEVEVMEGVKLKLELKVEAEPPAEVKWYVVLHQEFVSTSLELCEV